ncbi:hypothetical protein CTAYLR_001322 [Chrysophaeum taylorii]|uniref:Phospholipase/carboxylesterase/thioesterase domain-containing protein n=1 Tax=Chrysophaeum taylorii TaxID=2483200 RepID=A0AAD7U7G0_9STRA|nr:hypothetical protein CTAYLR_001322 [Chrysophaeum taylorii]
MEFRVDGKRGACVRERIGLESRMVRILPQGTIVRVVEERDGRCRLGEGGWVSRKVLTSDREIALLSATAIVLAEERTHEVRVREGRLGHLDCKVVAISRRPTMGVVFAHGAASSTDDLLAPAKALILDHGLREAAIFLPEGPFGVQGLRAWWDPKTDDLGAVRTAASVRALFPARPLAPDLEPRADRKAVARAVNLFVDALRAASDLVTLGPAQMWFGGFDQGATLAFDVFRVLETPPAGLFLLSPTSLFSPGRLPSDTPVFLAHAQDDAIVPPLVATAALASLRAAGLRDIRVHTAPGGRDLSYHTLRALGRFLLRDDPPAPAEEGEAVPLVRAHLQRNPSFKQFLHKPTYLE